MPGSGIVNDGSFRRSTYSGAGNCVEVAVVDDRIEVRNSRSRDRRTLVFTRDEWRAFIAGAKDGEFDVPETAV